MKNKYFDDLRPYYDEEIPEAMNRIADYESFSTLSSYIYPDKSEYEIKSMLKGFTTIDDFQSGIMTKFVAQVIKRTITQLTYEGLSNLDNNNQYLFVSNHRDIVLDSSLFQYILYTSGFRTTEITFGSNLMNPQLVVDIGRSNKMFKVIREGKAKDFYYNSLHLSDYIYYTLQQKKESVWIAQRNGRTKDGKDFTDQGIIKMFYMSSSDTPVKAIAALNIVPVSISYEWEPCDFLKTLELYQSRFAKYIKKPGEDLSSILTGITQFKGAVHINIGSPISEMDLASLAGLPNNKFNMQVASLIDKQVHENYKLTCYNYIAHDLRSQKEQYKLHYTEEEKEQFIHRHNELLSLDVEDKKILGDIFLGIYANPVDIVLNSHIKREKNSTFTPNKSFKTTHT